MTMFASITPAVRQCGADDCVGCQTDEQHNPPNPILEALRQGWREDGSPLPMVAGDYLAALEIYSSHAGADVRPSEGWEDRDPFDLVTAWPPHYIGWAERDHARRVLTRLANLTERSPA